ncbi:MAG TPA: class I SAM-dependent methyltransferase [Chitinophagaceae bacterium]|nr:class I SAM-dependent methyltransferase [Chitinophagaceae bacterium]
MPNIPYEGKELELFQHASVWKNYFGSFVKPYLKGRVLEVGAGLGSTTLQLCTGEQQDWICLEPDQTLFEELNGKIHLQQLPPCCVAVNGTIDDLLPGESFNAILYIDVIEHISNDRTELVKAAKLLASGGYLIVLVPAHQWLITPFDNAIGHLRRYNKKELKAAGPIDLELHSSKYLDSCGLIALIANKFFLKQAYPTLSQIRFWDKVMIRISRITDVLTAYSLGKSLITIWKR